MNVKFEGSGFTVTNRATGRIYGPFRTEALALRFRSTFDHGTELYEIAPVHAPKVAT